MGNSKSVKTSIKHFSTFCFKWQNKHRVVVISVCSLSAESPHTSKIFQNYLQKALDKRTKACYNDIVIR